MRLMEALSQDSRAQLIAACNLAAQAADRRAADRIRRRERTRDEKVSRACDRGAAGYTSTGWPIRPIK